MSTKEEIILELGRSPALAHAVLFGRAHTHETPSFHLEMINDWHSEHKQVLSMAFRGAAKSTLAEEGITVEACLQRTENCVVLGETETRAVDRLRTVKHHFETNEFILQLFGISPGDIWTETKITLSNGVMIQAYGRGQSLRGAKHIDKRPDLFFIDDLENEDSVRNPDTIAKTFDYFFSSVMPARAPGGRFRIAATPLAPNALAPTLARDPGWLTRTYPIESLDEAGERKPTWKDRYPIEWIDEERRKFLRAGKLNQFMQEYMCQAVDPSSQIFTPDMIKIEPSVRSWHPVYAIYDPARTTHKTSSTTGKVVASILPNKIIVWEASGKRWMPNEIIDDIFQTDERYSPVAIGVEENGLNEFLLQPIRSQSILRGHTIPLRALHAPKGKLDFIKSLQPFFKASELVFAQDLPDLREQLLGFPTGDIDVPNALAYILRMRPGLPVYETFSDRHISPLPSSPLSSPSHPFPSRIDREPLWLALHATPAVTAAALLRAAHGLLWVAWDALREGPPGDVLPDLLALARLEAPNGFRAVAPPANWSPQDQAGLRAACARAPLELRKGAEPVQGREEVRALLRRLTRDEPSLKVSPMARWTVKALSGGYCRAILKTGAPAELPDENAYSVLMNAIESFTGLLRGGEAEETERTYAYTPEGRRYVTARVG